MATCPSCGCDLPGMETICRDCFEKQYAEKFGPRKTFWQKLNELAIPIIVAAIIVTALQMSRLREVLGVVVVTAQWVLTAGVTAIGIWDSLKAGSAKTLLLWLMYVPFLAGFLLWKVTGRGGWLSLAIAGGLLMAAQRYNARRQGLI